MDFPEKRSYNANVMIEIAEKHVSEDGTTKFLFRFPDGVQVETVRLLQPYGTGICISSEAGCSMGCAFCASGLKKKIRNLTREEMLLQVLLASPEEEAASRVVVMGTGEPFDNLDEVLAFCNLLSDERLLKDAADRFREALPQMTLPSLPPVAPRHITVSTCGLPEGIRRFSETEKRFALAISLHAPNDALRDRLMPVNRRYPLSVLMDAATAYCERTGRRIAFEYLLLKGVNDRPEDAKELSRLLLSSPQHAQFYVNLIPYNGVKELSFEGSPKETALSFYDVLMQNGIKATLRKERGADIAAACGQLRLHAENRRS